MINKKRKVEFPFMADDAQFEVDERVIYSNEDLLTKRKDNKIDSSYDMRDRNSKRSAGISQYETKNVFQPKKTTVRPKVDYAPKRDSKAYEAPQRPKEYVYPTERKDEPETGHGLEKRPLGEKKSLDVQAKVDSPKPKRDFDLLAQKSMPVSQKVEENTEDVDKDYFAKKRNSLFESGNY